MTQASSGDTVRVHYTGTLGDGTKFDSSEGREPLEFILGAEQLIPAFEQAVVGMSKGDSKIITIQAQDAYGDHQHELVSNFPRSEIPSEIELHEGLQLSAQDPDGNTVNFVVVAFSEQEVTLDANHPLAGQDLTFDIEVVEILAVA